MIVLSGGEVFGVSWEYVCVICLVCFIVDLEIFGFCVVIGVYELFVVDYGGVLYVGDVWFV